MTVLLAFDTSTERLAAAVRGRGRDRHADEAGGARASAALLPCLRALLVQADVAWTDVDAIAFGRGPGAFTGLRTSCAVAQGLGFGLARPLLAIDSLQIVAEDAREQAGGDVGEIGVAMDARMDEVYAARYRWSALGWQTVSGPALYTLPALRAAWQDAPDCVAGSALGALAARLDLPERSRRFATEGRRAAALLRLAQAAYDAGAGVDAAAALPLYLRDKVAQTTDERAAARAAAAPR